MPLLFAYQHWPPSSYVSPGVDKNLLFVLRFKCISSRNRPRDNIIRLVANYHRSVWTPDFVESLQDDYKLQYQEKLKEIRRVLGKTITGSPLESFAMIGTLQHLAIDYHFQEEIHHVLSSHYTSLINGASVMASFDDENSLFNVSLCFRLLRQNGYPITTDVFNIFLDKDGKFRKQLSKDLRGMMNLYQAAHFGIEGETVLDHAGAFSSINLHNLLPQLNQDQATIVSDALDNPNSVTLTRSNVKYYLKVYETEKGTFGNLVQEFAKIDFNNVQSLHQKELNQVLSWWRQLGLAQKLSFARDQPVKWYMWSMATLSDPVVSEQRIELTKSISLVYLMDDIFDVHGTLSELVLLAEAIDKWELDAMEQIPHSMKTFLNALYDTTNEISDKILKKHGWNPINSLKKSWKRLCNAFLVEAKWFATGHLPASEEYLKNGVISTGVHLVLVHLFFLLGQGINKENVELVDDVPDLIFYTATILRLWDDLGSSKEENQQGYDGSYIECYMREHTGSTTESARKHVFNMISSTWKKLNKEFLTSNSLPLAFKKGALNAAGMVCFMYSYDRNQRLPVLERLMKSLLYESISVHNN